MTKQASPSPAITAAIDPRAGVWKNGAPISIDRFYAGPPGSAGFELIFSGRLSAPVSIAGAGASPVTLNASGNFLSPWEESEAARGGTGNLVHYRLRLGNDEIVAEVGAAFVACSAVDGYPHEQLRRRIALLISHQHFV